MKPLSQGFKAKVYEWLVYGRLSVIAKPLYWLLLVSELGFHRFVDIFHPKDTQAIDDLSLIIKTFERPYAVNRLVKSILRRYPKANIIVVDDSQNPQDIKAATMLKMPFDSGISAGRNAALEICKTPFFLLLDDDFVFSHRQNLSQLCAFMRAHDEVDIVGGRYVDLPLYVKHDFQKGVLAAKNPAKIALGTQIGNYEVVDKVQNYFIGRTTSIRKLRWDDALKTMEHTDFFRRAKGVLCTAFDPDMLILHAKWPFDLAYMKKRFRVFKS